MSFVISAPEIVTAAAGNLAGIGSTLGEATAAATGPTTSVAAAAADDVSIALSQLFGAYGRQFQALSAQAAAFHDEFVSLLNGSAAAYLSTEIASASVAAATNPIVGAASGGGLLSSLDPILGGTDGGLLGGLSPTLNGLSSIISGGPLGPILGGVGQEIGSFLTFQFGQYEFTLLPSLFAAGVTASAAGEPWQVLFANTSTNLQTIFDTWASHPFPVLNQVIINQNGYAQTFWGGVALAVQNWPTTLANMPANIQLGIQGAAATFVPSMQSFINQQNSYNQTISTGLQNAGADLQKTLPVFDYDMGMAGRSVVTGDYYGAVRDVPRAFLSLFLSGVDTSNLTTIKVEGPAGDLLPVASVGAEQEQSFVNLLPPGSIPTQMAQNFVNALNTSTLPLGFAVIGPPIAALDGLATGATAFGAALQTGNGVAAVGALVDMPAYVLNGFLNGRTVIDLTIPVTETVNLPGLPPIGPNTPVVVHMPFDGILTPPQQISATLEVPALDDSVQIVTVTFGGTQYGGLIPELVDYMPEQIAAAISPT